MLRSYLIGCAYRRTTLVWEARKIRLGVRALLGRWTMATGMGLGLRVERGLRC